MSVRVSNQSTYPLEYHFRGSRVEMRSLVQNILAKLQHELDFELKIGKAYVGLLHTLVFAALHIQSKKVIVEFTSRKQVDSPRIIKSKQFQKSRWAYYVEVKTTTEFDDELLRWIKESYE